jgi:hypothetical protein
MLTLSFLCQRFYCCDDRLIQNKEDDYKKQQSHTTLSKFTPATLRMIETIWGAQSLHASALITPARIVLCPTPQAETIPPTRPNTPPPSTSAGPLIPEAKTRNEKEYYSEEEKDTPPIKKIKM